MTTIDLRKVVYCSLFWENQYGNICLHKPKGESVHGIRFDPGSYAHFHHDYPSETNYERALRLDLLDCWTPIIVCNFTASRRVKYRGKRALNLWAKWNERIFK